MFLFLFHSVWFSLAKLYRLWCRLTFWNDDDVCRFSVVRWMIYYISATPLKVIAVGKNWEISIWWINPQSLAKVIIILISICDTLRILLFLTYKSFRALRGRPNVITMPHHNRRAYSLLWPLSLLSYCQGILWPAWQCVVTSKTAGMWLILKHTTYSRPPRGDCSAQKSWLLGATSLYFFFAVLIFDRLLCILLVRALSSWFTGEFSACQASVVWTGPKS